MICIMQNINWKNLNYVYMQDLCPQKSEKNDGPRRNDEGQGLNDEGQGLYVPFIHILS